jgi:hypothetical protein
MCCGSKIEPSINKVKTCPSLGSSLVERKKRGEAQATPPPPPGEGEGDRSPVASSQQQRAPLLTPTRWGGDTASVRGQRMQQQSSSCSIQYLYST